MKFLPLAIIAVGSALAQNIILTPSEVARHNTANDAWVIINGNVYDVTKFLDDHPGGSRVLISNAGTDATAKYNAAGHPPNTLQTMGAQYRIGAVNGPMIKGTTATPPVVQPPVVQPPVVQPPVVQPVQQQPPVIQPVQQPPVQQQPPVVQPVPIDILNRKLFVFIYTGSGDLLRSDQITLGNFISKCPNY